MTMKHTATLKARIKVSVLSVCLFCAHVSHAQAQENLARLAEVSGPGKNLLAAVDGVKQEHGTGEWIGDNPNHWWGGIVYPALEMQWKQAQKVNKVVVYDCPQYHAGHWGGESQSR